MKIRLTRIEILEFEPNSDFYPEGSTLKQMMDIEFDNLKDDPDLTLDSEKVVTTFKVEQQMTRSDWQTYRELEIGTNG